MFAFLYSSYGLASYTCGHAVKLLQLRTRRRRGINNFECESFREEIQIWYNEIYFLFQFRVPTFPKKLTTV